MSKKLLSLIIGLLFLTPFFISADGGLIILPPQISLDESEQNAIVAWNREEEVFILSIGLRAGAESSVLKIVPLPANPSKVEEGDFEIFDKLVEIINQKVEDYWSENIPSEGKDVAGAGVEITFHEKIGAHDITVAKVNNLDEFIEWVSVYLTDNELAYNELSLEFKNTVADYLERNIKFFVFDLVEANQTAKSIKPIIYRFPTNYLLYPIEITAFSDAGQTELSEINLFLITEEQINPETVYELNFMPEAGFDYPIELSQEELTEVSSEVASLFSSGAQVSQLYYYGRLSNLNRDLVIANLIKTADNPKVYQLIGNRKLWIPSPPVFNEHRFNWTDIEIVSPNKIDDYPKANLVRASDDPKVYYLTEGGLKRHIPSVEAFNSYGNNWEDIIEITSTELNAYPDSILIRLTDDPKVYKLENNQKRWIKTAKAFNRLGLNWNEIAPVNTIELNTYAEGGEIE